MDPLKRNNPGVRATNHEDRIQVLERRIIPDMVTWAHVTLGLVPQSITAGSTERIAWEEFATDAPRLFGTIATGTSLPFNNTAGDEVLKVSTSAYAFLAFTSLIWEDDPAGYVHSVSLQASSLDGVTGSFFGGFGQMQWAELKPTSGDDSQYATHDFLQGISTPFASGTTGPTFSVHATNGDGVARDVTYASLTVYAWPINDDEDTDPRVYGTGI